MRGRRAITHSIARTAKARMARTLPAGRPRAWRGGTAGRTGIGAPGGCTMDMRRSPCTVRPLVIRGGGRDIVPAGRAGRTLFLAGPALDGAGGTLIMSFLAQGFARE